MPSNILNTSRINEPVFVQVQSAVRRHQSTAQIIAAVKERYPQVRQQTVDNYLGYLRGTQSSARRLNASSTTRDVLEIVVSSRVRKPSVVRVGYTFSFRNPETGLVKKVGDNIDIELPSTIGELQNQVRQTIRDWLAEHYEIRQGNQGAIGPVFRNLKIQEVEGF